MTPMMNRDGNCENDDAFAVDFRTSDAAGVPYEITARQKYHTGSRFRKNRGGAARLHNGARLKRHRRGGL